MSWSCVQIEERLSDYLENALSENERREFREHMDACSRCAPLVEQLGGMLGRLHALEMEAAPPMLVTKIVEQTLGPRKSKTREWLSWIPVLWQPRVATGMVTVLATVMIIWHATGVKRADLTLADFNPVNIVQTANRKAHLAFARGVKFVNDLKVVYEIQSRLQPATSGTPGQQAPSTTPSEQESKPPSSSQQDRFGTPGNSEVAEFIANGGGRSAL